MTTSLKDRLVAPLLHALRSGGSIPTLREKHANLFELVDADLARLHQSANQPDAPVSDHTPSCPPESQLLH